MTDVSTTERVDSLDFGLEYDGAAVANHEMDVRDLAPALLNAGNLFQTLNRLLHPTDPEVQVNIRATNEGSFLIELKLLYDHAADVLGNRGLIETEGLTGLIAVAVGLIGYLRKRGQAGEPDQTGQLSDGVVRLSWPDGTVLEVPASVLQVSDNPVVRRPLAEVVRPVGQDGIDAVRLVRNGAVLGEIDKENLPAFQADGPLEGQILDTRDREMYLRILTSAWQVGRKWRFTDGRWPFWAAIVDDRFNEGLVAGERYGANDLLHCVVRETQWQDETGLHSEITVLQVIERVDAAQQPTLDIY